MPDYILLPWLHMLGSVGVSRDKRQLDKCVHSARESGWDWMGVISPSRIIGCAVGGEEGVV